MGDGAVLGGLGSASAPFREDCAANSAATAATAPTATDARRGIAAGTCRFFTDGAMESQT